MKAIKEGVTEERSVRGQWNSGWAHATGPHTTTLTLALYHTCRSTEKLEKISALRTHKKRKSAPGFALTVFTQQGKTQIASDPIYITLHNFMITVRQRSSQTTALPFTCRQKRQDGKHFRQAAPHSAIKDHKQRPMACLSECSQYSKLAHSHTKASHRILPETKWWLTPPCSDHFKIIDFKTGNSHPWLKSTHVT